MAWSARFLYRYWFPFVSALSKRIPKTLCVTRPAFLTTHWCSQKALWTRPQAFRLLFLFFKNRISSSSPSHAASPHSDYVSLAAHTAPSALRARFRLQALLHRPDRFLPLEHGNLLLCNCHHSGSNLCALCPQQPWMSAFRFQSYMLYMWQKSSIC